MYKKSSYHSFNGDSSSRVERVLALICNASYTLLPSSPVDTKIFNPDVSLYPSENIPAIDTPGRILSNLFWAMLPGEKIKEALNNQIHLLDMGCGSGRYYPKFSKIFSGLDSYTGVDLFSNDNWEDIKAQNNSISFIQDAAENIGQLLTHQNVLVSQSTLGLVEGDITFFESVANHVKEHNKPFIQIHLIPPFPLWRLRGVNGFRGYTDRNLERILKLFDNNSQTDIFLLGGRSCINLHKEMISDYLHALVTRIPSKNHHRANHDVYIDKVKQAISADKQSPPAGVDQANFLALTIASNLKNNPFDSVSIVER